MRPRLIGPPLFRLEVGHDVLLCNLLNSAAGTGRGTRREHTHGLVGLATITNSGLAGLPRVGEHGSSAASTALCRLWCSSCFSPDTCRPTRVGDSLGDSAASTSRCACSTCRCFGCDDASGVAPPHLKRHPSELLASPQRALSVTP